MIDDLFDAICTTRVFLDNPVPQTDIDAIINAANKAPSKNCLYPYRILALTNSEEAKKAKYHLYRYCCTTEWDIDKNDMLYYDFDRSTITSPKIHMIQCLRQIMAPLVLCFIGEFVDDKNEENLFFDTKNKFSKFNLNEVFNNGHVEIGVRVIRDNMIACSWAQMKAQELGYDSAFVGNGEQHDNSNVNKNPTFNISDTENIIVLLCIGNEDKTRWDGLRCEAEEYIKVDDEITDIVFYEKHRKGEKEFRNASVNHLIL